ncbi:VRG4 [Ecytonucleospora hepatopenaei]|uniref:GDP-mannose transporter n=1 Tax=Ecytonucleospora hepatopenaei TaxID=646526 RepID=A0A1W0E5N2_9MICR|nr:VRG4 [Ecytonucleospora hepatopenaei]
MLIEKICAINLYFFSSVITTLLNKEIVYKYSFNNQYLLTLIQSLVICSIIYIYSLCQYKKFKSILFFKGLKNWIKIGFLLTGMIISNMKAITYLDVSIYTLYKNCGIILTAAFEWILFKKKISKIGFVSLFFLLITSYTVNLKTKVTNVNIQLQGYIWIIFNILATTGYVISMKSFLELKGTKTESVFFTNFLSIPLLGGLSVALEKNNVEIGFSVAVLIVLSAIFALMTAFSTAWTLKTISTTTYSMLGASNKLLLSACAIFWFNEEKNVIKLLSLLIGILSGFVYSYDSALQK